MNFLAYLNSANYHNIISIKKSIAQEVLWKRPENGGVFVPLSLTPNEIIYFAIDNVDVSVDTPDGDRKFYGIGTAVYQRKSSAKLVMLMIIKMVMLILNIVSTN